jgi:outer membrane scaffolding protein for murein synthesis (MipA/OmpV family)
MRSNLMLAATASLLFGGAAAHAADAVEVRGSDPMFAPVPVASDAWIVTLRATVSAAPKFEGADRFGLVAFPGLGFRRAGEPVQFSAPDDGADFALYRQNGFSAGPVARFRPGRYLGDDARLFGLHDVRWSVEPGVFVEYWATPSIRARAEVRHGVRSRESFVADFGVDWVSRLGAFTAALGPRLRIADAAYQRDYYGVSFAESVLSGRFPSYRPGGGVNSVGAAASLGYQWSEAWGTTVFAGYRRLMSDAERSPVVRTIGSPNQFEVGASLSYSFRMGL